LRAPLGLDFSQDELSAEACDIHIAAYADGILAGCLVMVLFSDSEVKIRQVAVRENLQRKGFGSALTRFAEQLASEKGFASIVLHARQSAVPFYQIHGYLIDSEPFVEVTIPHIRMRKNICS